MNDLDALLNLDPLELAKDDRALDAIIAHYRAQRAKGGKAKKETGPAQDLSSVMAKLTGAAKPAETIKRRL